MEVVATSHVTKTVCPATLCLGSVKVVSLVSMATIVVSFVLRYTNCDIANLKKGHVRIAWLVITDLAATCRVETAMRVNKSMDLAS